MGSLKVGLIKKNGNLSSSTKQLLILTGIVLLECLMFSILHPNFLTVRNFTNIVRQMVTLANMALGITFVLVCGGIDLSLGSIMSVVSVVIGLVLVYTNSVIVGVLAGLAIGVLFGFINGYITAYKGIQPFAVTLGTMSIGAGLALVLCNGDAVRGLPDNFDFIGNGEIAGIPFQVIIVFILVIICYIALHNTDFGVMCYASGGNEHAARLSGVNVRFIRMLSFVISGLFAAISAIIATSRASSGLPTLGVNNTQMQAIAAAVIGGASLSGGQGSIIGTMLGVIFITILYNGANLVGISPYVQDLMIGSVIIISAGIDMYRRKKNG